MGQSPIDRPGTPPASFSVADALRIARQVRWAERRPRNTPPVRGRYPIAAALASGIAKIAQTGSEGIPAMVGNTPGSGAIEIYDFSGSSLADSGPGDTGYNVANQDVEPLTIVVVLKIDGKWVVILEPCPGGYY